MGNNPAAILVTIGILVETGSGPFSWSALAGAAEREGLLAPPAAPSLAGMLLGAWAAVTSREGRLRARPT